MLDKNSQEKSSTHKTVNIIKGLCDSTFVPCSLCKDGQYYPVSKIYEHVQRVHENRKVLKRKPQNPETKARTQARWRYNRDFKVYERQAMAYFPITKNNSFPMFESIHQFKKYVTHQS